MKPFLFAWICMATGLFLACAEDTFVYTASPWQVARYNNDLIIGFNLRVKGEIYTVTDFRFPKNSEFRIYFEDRIKLEELEYCYFEIRTNRRIPKTRLLTVPRMDIITKQTMQDLLGYAEKQQAGLFEGLLPDEMIVSVRRITQNEYLQITPKIVPDPTKAK